MPFPFPIFEDGIKVHRHEENDGQSRDNDEHKDGGVFFDVMFPIQNARLEIHGKSGLLRL